MGIATICDAAHHCYGLFAGGLVRMAIGQEYAYIQAASIQEGDDPDRKR